MLIGHELVRKMITVSYWSSISNFQICRTPQLNNDIACEFTMEEDNVKDRCDTTNQNPILDSVLSQVSYNLLHQKIQIVIFMQRKLDLSKSYFHHVI